MQHVYEIKGSDNIVFMNKYEFISETVKSVLFKNNNGQQLMRRKFSENYRGFFSFYTTDEKNALEFFANRKKEALHWIARDAHQFHKFFSINPSHQWTTAQLNLETELNIKFGDIIGDMVTSITHKNVFNECEISAKVTLSLYLPYSDEITNKILDALISVYGEISEMYVLFDHEMHKINCLNIHQDIFEDYNLQSYEYEILASFNL